MSFTADLFGGGVDKFAINLLIGELTPERRKSMATGLKNWLENKARKKESMAVPSYIAEMSRRIDRMCETMELEVKDGKPVVKALGENEATLRALELGTNWFEPCDDVVIEMISTLWKS